MKKLYEKSRLAFAIVWIVAYCVLMSIGDSLSESVGISKAVTLPIALTMSVTLLIFIKRNGLSNEYGLRKSKVPAGKMLFYLPLAILMSANLIYGFKPNLSLAETALYILTMLCVGFLEEVIFRGLLFKSMAENGVKSAIIVSSITFGIGHFVNLINGSGAKLLPNICQVVSAIAIGFLFVALFHKTKSLWAPIIAHAVINSFSAFAVDITNTQQIITSAVISVIAVIYGMFILKNRGKVYE